MIDKNKKGSILYFSVLLVGLLFSAGITATTVLVQKLGTIRDMSYSTSAFYAADAGIEKVLYRWNEIEESSTEINYDYSFEETLSGGQSYTIRKEEIGGSLVITATGSYQGQNSENKIRRGIQIIGQ